MVYQRTRSTSTSLVSVAEGKGKYRFSAVAILFYILQNIILRKVRIFRRCISTPNSKSLYK